MQEQGKGTMAVSCMYVTCVPFPKNDTIYRTKFNTYAYAGTGLYAVYSLSRQLTLAILSLSLSSHSVRQVETLDS